MGRSCSWARRRNSGTIPTRAFTISSTRNFPRSTHLQTHQPKRSNTMRDSIETRLGMFFALAIIAALVILESLGTFAFFKRGYHLHALFKTVQELKVGDAVKMGGVRSEQR